MGAASYVSLNRTIHMVRHGETIWNRERRYQGQMDVPISADGERQAAQTAEFLSSCPISACFASDLLRTFETARLITESRGVTVVADADLREVSYGSLEGKHRSPGVDSPFHDMTDVHSRPPDGESLTELGTRVEHFLQRLQSEEELLPPGDVLLVSHGVTMRVLLTLMLDLPLEAAKSFYLDNCSLTTVTFRGELPALLSCYNDTSHLSSPVVEVAS